MHNDNHKFSATVFRSQATITKLDEVKVSSSGFRHTFFGITNCVVARRLLAFSRASCAAHHWLFRCFLASLAGCVCVCFDWGVTCELSVRQTPYETLNTRNSRSPLNLYLDRIWIETGVAGRLEIRFFGLDRKSVWCVCVCVVRVLVEVGYLLCKEKRETHLLFGRNRLIRVEWIQVGAIFCDRLCSTSPSLPPR